MAGRGPAPKPADQRRRRNVPAAGEWVDLPPERIGRAPKWPLGNATAAQAALWRQLWRTPQATQWERMGLGVHLDVARYVALTIDVADGMGPTAMLAVLPEIRQISDRLGLNPKGLQDRRWRIGRDLEAPEVADPALSPVTSIAAFRSRMEE